MWSPCPYDDGVRPVRWQTTVNIRSRNIYIWVDFFITVLFFVDLAVRAHLRDRAKTPGVLGFLRKNWTDCLALFTDVPGVTGVGALSFLVLTRFRHVVRLMRVARILKVGLAQPLESYKRASSCAMWTAMMTRTVHGYCLRDGSCGVANSRACIGSCIGFGKLAHRR